MLQQVHYSSLAQERYKRECDKYRKVADKAPAVFHKIDSVKKSAEIEVQNSPPRMVCHSKGKNFLNSELLFRNFDNT